MDSENNMFEKLGGRKFLVTAAVLISLITVAIVQPTALTTELVVGLLGVIATYSGSNAFLTSFAMKHAEQNIPATSAPIVENNDVAVENNTPDHVAAITDLQQRMSQNEATTAEIVEIIKQLMQRK